MQKAASDAFVKIPRKLGVEVGGEWRARAQERDEQIAAVRIFMRAQRRSASTQEAVASSLKGGLQELDQRALNRDNGKPFALIGSMILKHLDGVEIPQREAPLEVRVKRFAPPRARIGRGCKRCRKGALVIGRLRSRDIDTPPGMLHKVALGLVQPFVFHDEK